MTITFHMICSLIGKDNVTMMHFRVCLGAQDIWMYRDPYERCDSSQGLTCNGHKALLMLSGPRVVLHLKKHVPPQEL